MPTYYDDVGEFHTKFGLPVGGTPNLVGSETFMYRWKFLHEELNELLEAYLANDLPRAADALADLVWVALGTAHFFGLPFDRVWDEVRRANLEKVRGPGDPNHKRGTAEKIVKPEGWRPPDVYTAIFGKVTS